MSFKKFSLALFLVQSFVFADASINVDDFDCDQNMREVALKYEKIANEKLKDGMFEIILESHAGFSPESLIDHFKIQIDQYNKDRLAILKFISSEINDENELINSNIRMEEEFKEAILIHPDALPVLEAASQKVLDTQGFYSNYDLADKILNLSLDDLILWLAHDYFYQYSESEKLDFLCKGDSKSDIGFRYRDNDEGDKAFGIDVKQSTTDSEGRDYSIDLKYERYERSDGHKGNSAEVRLQIEY